MTSSSDAARDSEYISANIANKSIGLMARPAAIKCGVWIYPGKDTNLENCYPIEKSLVLGLMSCRDLSTGIFPMDLEVQTLLTEERYLIVTSEDDGGTLIVQIEAEPGEPRPEVKIRLPYGEYFLPRRDDVANLDEDNPDWPAILLVDVLLMTHLDDNRKLPIGFFMREAHWSEIDHLSKSLHDPQSDS